MQGIQFEEENGFKSGIDINNIKRAGMTRWLTDKGIFKTEKQAVFVLFFISLVAIILTVVIMRKNFSNNLEVKRTPQVESIVQEMENRTPQQ